MYICIYIYICTALVLYSTIPRKEDMILLCIEGLGIPKQNTTDLLQALSCGCGVQAVGLVSRHYDSNFRTVEEPHAITRVSLRVWLDHNSPSPARHCSKVIGQPQPDTNAWGIRKKTPTMSPEPPYTKLQYRG